VPASVRDDNAKLQSLILEYLIDFYEVVTDEKMKERGL
jgi:hypothetical protein